MAEQSAEQPEVVESTVVQVNKEETTITPSDDHSSGYIIPRGAIAFGVIMILGYALYFFMIWSEVVSRGGQ